MIDGVIRAGEVVIDDARHVVTIKGMRVNFTPKEYRLLMCLARRPGEVLHVERLAAAIGYSENTDSRTICTHFARMRKKSPHLRRLLSTVREFGYKLEVSA